MPPDDDSSLDDEDSDRPDPHARLEELIESSEDLDPSAEDEIEKETGLSEVLFGAGGDAEDASLERAGSRPDASQGPQIPPDRPLDPPKLVRLANLAREVLEEVRQMNPQDSTVQELASLYGRVEDQLKDALPRSLAEELDAMNLDLPFKDGASHEEVRIAYSGLTGWLGGLFQGLHASLLAAAPILEAGPGAAQMPPGSPAPRPGLQPARRPNPEERKGEGYL